MQLTICIPYFNDSKNLINLLDSIRLCNTDSIEYEIIICGTDTEVVLEDILEEWKKKLPLSLFNTHKKTSASVNLNKGIELARGKVFCRIDSHCKIDRDFLQLGLAEFQRNFESFSAVGPSVEIISEKNNSVSKIISKLYMSPFLMGPSKFKRSYFYKNFSGATDSIFLGFYSTKDLKELGGFDATIQRKQDIELLERLKNKTSKPLYNAGSVIVKYILKQDTFFSICKRCFFQGTYLFTSLRSSRLIHFIPIVAVILFLIILYSSIPASFAIALLYLFLCSIFGLIETLSLNGLILSFIIFPACHCSYVFGNLYGFLKQIYQKS